VIELLVLMKTPIMELLNSKKNISSIFGNNRYDTSHRDVIKHQISIINIISSLLTVSRWSDVFYIDGKLSFKNWKFENNDHMIFYENLLNGTESERFISIIDQLLTTELNSSRVLQVVASNNVNDIISRISDWNFDVNTLHEITKDNDCIISAVQLKMMFTEWPNNIHMDHSYYRGHILTFDNNEGVIMEKDKRGFIMGNYTLTMPNQLEVKVRFTHIPSSYHIVFNMMELVLEHRIGGFTPILEENISGFKIYAIKMPITNEAINSLLGTTNDNHQLIAVQSKGILEINKNTPLNLECQSLAVSATRGSHKPKSNNHLEMYELIQNRPWFNNLIEIIIDGQLHFASMIDHTHIVR